MSDVFNGRETGKEWKMTIREYYEHYSTKEGRKTIRYPLVLVDGSAKTVAELYDTCIKAHVEMIQKNAVAWHEMLMRYVKREDAVFWIRRYESSSQKAKAENNGRWPIRRACKTEYDDLSYVFVSNFDAHEILNMIRFVDAPSDDEFADLMKTNKFPLHYDDGEGSDENYIAVYPKVGSPKAGVLTVGHWYLAHILGVNKDYRCPVDFNAMCPRGNLSDWSKQGNVMVRKIAGKFPGERDLIVAHFLRFIDPLNYYVVPGKNFQDNHEYYFRQNQIGEYSVLCNYVAAKYCDIYGEKVMEEFREKVFANSLTEVSMGGQCNIDISYGANICTKSKSSTGAASSPASTQKDKSDSITEVKAEVAGCSEVEVGKLARGALRHLLVSNKVSESEIEQLLKAETSKEIFGLNYPALVAIDSMDARLSCRYYAGVLDIQNKKYRLCNDWYERNRERLVAWLKAHGSED